MNEAADVAQNRPLWRLMSTFGATHSQWCVSEMKKKIIRLLAACLPSAALLDEC